MCEDSELYFLLQSFLVCLGISCDSLLCYVYTAMHSHRSWPGVLFDGGAVQVEQSLGLGIMPFFNKHSISLTRFIQILPKKFHKAGSKAPPPIVVLHARSAFLLSVAIAVASCCRAMVTCLAYSLACIS